MYYPTPVAGKRQVVDLVWRTSYYTYQRQTNFTVFRLSPPSEKIIENKFGKKKLMLYLCFLKNKKMILSEDVEIVERYFRKDINVYEVVTSVTTKIFVEPYVYWKKKRNGELDLVSVEGYVREVIRDYVHFEPAVNIMIGSIPKHNDLVFSGNI